MTTRRAAGRRRAPQQRIGTCGVARDEAGITQRPRSDRLAGVVDVRVGPDGPITVARNGDAAGRYIVNFSSIVRTVALVSRRSQAARMRNYHGLSFVVTFKRRARKGPASATCRLASFRSLTDCGAPLGGGNRLEAPC